MRASTATRQPSAASTWRWLGPRRACLPRRPPPARPTRGPSATPRAAARSDAALNGAPVASATSWSHRFDAPGANTSRTSSAPASAWSTRPPVRACSAACELRREQLAVQVVLVVDGRDREMDLRRPVGRAAAVGPAHVLVALDEIPPERVEVAVGIRVERALEVRHDQHPAREHEERGALRGRERRCDARRRVRSSTAATSRQPLGIAGEAAHEHRDPLGGERVRGAAEEPRERGVALAVVDGVAELVEHRVHPPFARLDVAQHAYVAGTVDVDAEGVLALAVACVEVAVLEHRAHVEPEPVVGAQGERLEVGVDEEVVERRPRHPTAGSGRTGRRDATVGARRASSRIAPASDCVERGLPRRERRRGRAVDVVERGEQPLLVELAGGEREREVVAVAELACGLVAEPRELADALGDLGARSASAPPRRPCASAASSLVRRISAISLSSTRRPSIVPRKLLKVDSTPVSSSTIARRRSAGTWCGTNASWSSSSCRRERAASLDGCGAGGAQLREQRRGPRAAPAGRARPAVRRASASGDEFVFDSHHASASSISRGRRRASRSATSSSGVRMAGFYGADATVCSARPSAGVACSREHGARLSGERLVDHLPFEVDRGFAPCGGGVVRGEEPAGPSRAPRVTARRRGWRAVPVPGGCTASRGSRGHGPARHRRGSGRRRSGS